MRFVGTSLFAIVAAVALSGCSTQFKDITVETEADPRIDLKGYETYAWAGAAAVIRDPNRDWTPADVDLGAEITFLVDQELRGKGFTQVASGPDMLVVYAVGVDMMSLNVEFDQENVARFEEVPKGGVVIILADADSRRAIWVGGAVAELLEKPDRELAKQRLAYAISKMFKGFPG
jgi:hypothetical protein